MSVAPVDRDYRSASLRVLSLWQPWASLCVSPDPEHGGLPAKMHETREWVPRLATPFAVAIHATKTFNAGVREALEDERFKAALRRTGYYPGDPRPILSGKFRTTFLALPLGAIVGLAWVDQVTRMGSGDGWTTPRDADDEHFGNWLPGRFAWALAAAVRLPEPVPFTGRQEPLYDLDLSTRERINEQLRSMERLAQDGDPSRVLFTGALP